MAIVLLRELEQIKYFGTNPIKILFKKKLKAD
jgi:hypothetical protein